MIMRFAPLWAASFVSASAAFAACGDGSGPGNTVTIGQDSVPVIGDGNVVQVGEVKVVPNPATAADTVKLVFDLRVTPARTVTMTAFIDGKAQVSQTRTGEFDGAFELVLGSGADLIATFGPGFHSAILDLRTTEPNEITVLQGTSFQLQ